ncbi:MULTISPECIES: hypothetical protein [unclassified Bartonella]|uniref:hypothetical protein n=1 Tax=Bartonella TaxID=773 RepID=UPI0035CEB88B
MLKLYTLLTKALWKMKVWALKKISKKSIWAGFADGSSRGQEKAASLRFFCTSSLLHWKEACLLEIKKRLEF